MIRRPLHIILITAVLSLSLTWSLKGQNQSCIGKINVTLDSVCRYVLPPDQVIKGGNTTNLKLSVDDNIPNGDTIDCPGTFRYLVTDERNVIVCWGFVTAEDKTPPIPVDTVMLKDTLECAQIGKILNNPLTVEETINGKPNKYYLGKVTFRENCKSCGCSLTTKFFDQVDYYPCDSLPYFARITRRWTATDCNDYTTDVYQYFFLVRPSFDTLHKVADYTLQTCSPSSVTVKERYPYWLDCFGDTLFLNKVDCNLTTSIEKNRIESCDDGSYKIENYVKVFDWCTNAGIFVDTFIVKVGDFKAPVFNGNATPLSGSNILDTLRKYVDRDSLVRLHQEGKLPVISTGPMDCTAGLLTDENSLQELFGFQLSDCQDPQIEVTFYTFGPNVAYNIPIGDSIWRTTNYAMLNNMATGIPVGLHALVIDAEDLCYNRQKGVVFFQVVDRVAPVAKCDDLITVSISGGDPKQEILDGYAVVHAEDINEGSFDNCTLGGMKVRRQVVDLAGCMPFFIAKGYDSDGNGRIDEEDYFDENGNGKQDGNENNWVFKDGIWYTPWRDLAEFFCCDIGQKIVLELKVWDKAIHPLSSTPINNEGVCWMEIVVEDASTPYIAELESYRISCKDPILELLQEGVYFDGPDDQDILKRIRRRFGKPEIIANYCGNVEIEERIIHKLDHCGFGLIEREIVLTKRSPSKGTELFSLTQEITVVEHFDYTICLPEDSRLSCPAEPVPPVEISYQENGCDLIAVTTQDEYFYGTQDPDACYKIFRTYRIINWCEYDGESPPVVVSRDWDNWNGQSCEDNDYLNPQRPDGDDDPGDEGICIIVRRNFLDDAPDTVYYDRDTDPHNTIPDDRRTKNKEEGYWWKVISGNGDPSTPEYYSGDVICKDGTKIPSVWGKDPNDLPNDPNGSPAFDDDDIRYGSYGFWQYTQHILVYDTEAPILSVSSQDTFCSNADNCAATVELKIKAEDACIGSQKAGITVFVDLYSDQLELVDYSFALRDSLFSTQLPIGRHQLHIRADDGCGNTASEYVTIEVVDCKPPAPICIQGLSVSLMPGEDSIDRGMMVVWADEFVGSPVDDCTGQGPETGPSGNPLIKTYSINRQGAPAQRAQQALTLTCEDTSDVVIVEIHAWDEAGLHDYCLTYVDVKDNQEICTPQGPVASVAGIITTEDAFPLSNVEVELSGDLHRNTQTDETGGYRFETLELAYDYSIAPRSNLSARNGVSTYDLVMIQRHILGKEQLDSPYKIIAADANNSKAISVLDMIAIRKLILNIDTEYSKNSSWRFIDAGYQFPDPANPWKERFPEVVNLNDLDTELNQVDFVAVKIGDVTGNAGKNQAQSAEPRGHQNVWAIHTPSLALQAGQVYSIPFYGSVDDISGYQFTLNIEKESASMIDLEPGLARQEHFGWFPNSGHLTTSWIPDSSVRPSADGLLFVLNIRAYKDIALDQILGLSSRYTEAEAYSNDGEELGVRLDFTKASPLAFQLEQNFPNPFISNTNIEFYLPQDAAVQLKVHDLQGREIMNWNAQLSAGPHRRTVESQSLPGPGIYYYTLTAGTEKQTKRMLHIK